MHIKHWFCILVALGCILQFKSTVAQSVLMNAQYERQYAAMLQDPQRYLNQSQTIQASATTIERLQAILIKAEAFITLQSPNRAIETLQSGLRVLEEFEDQDMSNARAQFYERMSDVYLSTQNLVEARLAISDAIENTSLPTKQEILLQRLKKRANIDHRTGASISALQDLQLAVQLANALNMQEQIIELATQITLIHQQRNEHAIALSYAQRAIEVANISQDDDALLHVLTISMPSVLASRQLALAQQYLTRIEALLEKNTELFYNAKALQFAGELAYDNEQYQLAIDKLSAALSLFTAEQSLDIAHSHLLLSRAFTELDDMDMAIEHLVTAFNTIEGNTTDFNLVQNIHLHRAELLGRLNQFEEAFRVTKDVIAARDINQPIDEIKRMLDMHTNFQLQLQQQENIELKQKNAFQSSEIESKQMLNQLYFLVIGLLVSICFLLLLMFIRSRKHRKKLEQIAHTDALTGVYSRRRILEILDFQQDMYNRNLLPYSVAIVDLDFFKQINDKYGHQKGDEVLRDTAKLAQESFRKTDSVGRIGGEEFLFIFPDTPLAQAKRLLTKYSKHLHKIGKTRGIEQATTASIGLVQPEESEEPSSIISRADKALYQAKGRGRNQIVSDSYSPLDKA